MEKDKKIEAAGMYLLKLMRAALMGETVHQPPVECSMEMVFELAASNSVEGCVFYGLSKEHVPESLYRKWKSKCENTLFRQVCFDNEREKILKKMHEAGLSYLPLKGALIAGYYPQPGMRAIADNDILYGFVEKSGNGEYCIAGENHKERELKIRQAQEKMVEIMESLGYTVESLLGNHDTFLKEPCYNFEMHRCLVPTYMERFRQYYENSWKWATPDEKDEYLFAFSDEEEYLFFLAHTFKHFDQCGCGIRHIADEYVILKEKQEKMDWTYLKSHLQELGLVEFEEKLRSLTMHIMENQPLTEQEKNMYFYMLKSGTYGNLSTYVQNRLTQNRKTSDKGVKFRYLLGRVFLKPEEYREYHPFFYKHKWSRWILILYRLGKGLLFKQKAIIHELRLVRKAK